MSHIPTLNHFVPEDGSSTFLRNIVTAYNINGVTVKKTTIDIQLKDYILHLLITFRRAAERTLSKLLPAMLPDAVMCMNSLCSRLTTPSKCY